MKDSFQSKLLNLIKERKSVTYDEMVAFCAAEKHKTETLARKMRLVVKSGEVEPIWKGNVIVGWNIKGYAGDAGVRVEVPIRKPTDYDSKIVATINAIHPWKPNFNPTNQERLL